MNEPRLMERQRGLFPAEMNWHALPADVRRQVTSLLAAMCIEILDDNQTLTGDQDREPNED